MAMDVGAIFNSVYFWIGLTFVFLLLFSLLLILLIFLSKKTHMIVEFKAMLKGQPICLFFQENRYVDWRAEKVDAGIIVDKDYGAFIINEKGTYIDKRTKTIIIPFDAQFAVGLNIRAAKIVDDMQYILKDEEQIKMLRYAISRNLIDQNQSIDVLKTSVYIGAIKSMMNAMIPHNINAKIEKMVAARMANYGKLDPMQLLLIFGGVLGAIIVGYILLKSVAKT